MSGFLNAITTIFAIIGVLVALASLILLVTAYVFGKGRDYVHIPHRPQDGEERDGWE